MARTLLPYAFVVLPCVALATAGVMPGRHDDRPGASGSAAAAVRPIVRAAAQGLWSPQLRPEGEAARSAYERWLERNRESVEDSERIPEPLDVQPWGECTYRPRTDQSPARLYLHVFDWHASGKIVVYGLTGGVKNAYLLADPKRSKLELSKADEKWVAVVGPKRAPDMLDSVVVLELDGEPSGDRVVVSWAGEGTVPLFANEAIVHGKTLRYEPEPNKNTLGYWTDASDWAEWRFEAMKPGEYEVRIRYGCGKGSGGSTVDFIVAGEKLTFTVEETGGFQAWSDRKIGTVHLPPTPPSGHLALEVRPTKKPGLAVMDLQQVILEPAAKK